MSNLKYERVHPLPKSELIGQMQSGDPAAVAAASYAATRYEEDWSWVQTQCVQALESSHASVRWAAATCLGDLAFMRRPLDLKIVIPALEQAVRDPQISDPASFSLRMVREFLQEGSET